MRYILAFLMIFAFAFFFGVLVFGLFSEPLVLEFHGKFLRMGLLGEESIWKNALFFVGMGFVLNLIWGQIIGYAIGGFTEVEHVKTVLPLGSLLYILMILLFLDVGEGLALGFWGIIAGIVYNFGIMWGFLIGAGFAISMGKRWRQMVTIITYSLIIAVVMIVGYVYFNHLFERTLEKPFLY